MVTDVNSIASNRMNSTSSGYNMYWVPSCYYDGGLIYNSGMTQSEVSSSIQSAGAREVPDVDLSVTCTWLGSNTIEVTVTLTNNEFTNTIPNNPSSPQGPTEGVAEDEYTFSTSALDADGDDLSFMWDWGDGDISPWLGPYGSGTQVDQAHTWTDRGNYDIKVKTKDIYDEESQWSDVASIMMGMRGDANNDAVINVGDAVYIINYVFKGGSAPIPVEGGNANCDAAVNVGDAVYIINYVFKGGQAPGCP